MTRDGSASNATFTSTTVPAAGYVAVALVLGEYQKAAGSALQLFLNLLGIVVAAVGVLLFEALALLLLCRDMAASVADLAVVLVVGLSALTLPYGYLVGLVLGLLLHYLFSSRLRSLTRAD